MQLEDSHDCEGRQLTRNPFGRTPKPPTRGWRGPGWISTVSGCRYVPDVCIAGRSARRALYFRGSHRPSVHEVHPTAWHTFWRPAPFNSDTTANTDDCLQGAV